MYVGLEVMCPMFWAYPPIIILFLYIAYLFSGHFSGMAYFASVMIWERSLLERIFFKEYKQNCQ